MAEIYSLKIMQIAGNAPPPKRLVNPDAQTRRISRVCGSTIEVGLKLSGGVVSEYGQETNACVLGQASASILAVNIVGCTPEELKQVRHEVEAMLKEGGDPPSGKWADMKHLQPVKDFPQRHASTMLAFNAVVECLEKIEGKQT